MNAKKVSAASAGERPEGQAPVKNVDSGDWLAAWERVLDCGAPGPSRERPALFYQERQPELAPPAGSKHNRLRRKHAAARDGRRQGG